MRIKVLYFAEISKILNRKEENLDFAGRKVSELLQQIRKLHPEITDILDRSMVAVNLEYQPKDYTLKDKDVVAIIPPVEGG